MTRASAAICTAFSPASSYIPAGVPHLPANLSDKPASAVITRTDPNEQESVVLLPELDALVDFSRTAA